MGSVSKVIQIAKSINNVTKLMINLSLSPTIHQIPSAKLQHGFIPQACALLHTSARQYDLMEFFDDEKNWGKDRVKVGRSWKTDELRLKSNEDLHKLWFVLLKERNMLLTMEEACRDANKIFPNPERIDKIRTSMSNLELVVRERNRAFHLLETGETGERPGRVVASAIGYKFFYRMRQYIIPKFMNSKWYKKHMFGYQGYAVRKFLRLYNEKFKLEKRRAKNRASRQATVLLRRFPDMDIEALKERFPTVNIEKIKQSDNARGHVAP